MNIYKNNIADKNRYLIVAASSEIALSLINLIIKSERNPILFLLARDTEKLKTHLKNIIDEAEIHVIEYNMLTKEIPIETEWKIDYTIIFPGRIPHTPAEYKDSIIINFSGIVEMTEMIVKMYSSTLKNILITTSTAGIRVRKNNYIYGSAKAGLIGYCSGLRHKLYPQIHVTTLIPGPVQTKMIEGIKPPGYLLESPDNYAKKIYYAIFNKKKFVYSSLQWRILSFVLKNTPEFILLKIGYQFNNKN